MRTICISFLLLATFYISFAQCASNPAVNLAFVSSAGGSCTYNATFSITLLQNSLKVVQIDLPAGSSPAQVCFGNRLGSTMTSLPCINSGGSNFGNPDNNVTISSSPVTSVTIPCSLSTITFNASTSAQNNGNNCFSGTATATASPAPLKLLFFKAYSDNQKTYLNWETASEVNFDRFILQKSNNAIEFTEVNTIPASSNKQYEAVDENPGLETTYYRLKILDKDASFSYSKIIEVKKNGASEPMVYPVPSQGEVFLKGVESFDFYQLLDVSGNKINSKLIKSENGFKLATESKLSGGLYFLKLSNLNNSETLKILID
jgi:hypothetical protein